MVEGDTEMKPVNEEKVVEIPPEVSRHIT